MECARAHQRRVDREEQRERLALRGDGDSTLRNLVFVAEVFAQVNDRLEGDLRGNIKMVCAASKVSRRRRASRARGARARLKASGIRVGPQDLFVRGLHRVALVRLGDLRLLLDAARPDHLRCRHHAVWLAVVARQIECVGARLLGTLLLGARLGDHHALEVQLSACTLGARPGHLLPHAFDFVANVSVWRES